MTIISPINTKSFQAATVDGPAMANQGSLVGQAPSMGPLLPHVEDITAFPRDIDANQSIKRLLEMAELSFRSAETSRDFKRPGTALKDFIKAFYICVIIIQAHHDYPSLQSNWAELRRKHTSLTKQINALYPTYERIKQDITEDNVRTGAKPTGSAATATPRATGIAQTNSNTALSSPDRQTINMATSQQNRQSLPPLDFQRKIRPVVQPKPEALHGNVIRNGHGRSSSSTPGLAQDSLALRIAALRGPQPSPGQDPRIKTHPLVQQKPSGPREMPPTNKPKIGIVSSIPSLPKMPDAIYSPVRGTISEEAAKLPSSTPRGLFSRTGSSTSLTSNTSAPTQQSYRDYFPPNQSSATTRSPSVDRLPLTQGPVTSSRPSLDIPSGETITAQTLYELMKSRGSILIMDLRSREDFDEGHIMSTLTICIEADILTRDSPSCDQISESLVLSPNQEQLAFDRRNEYDLVVFYDEDSESIPRPPRNAADRAIVSMYRALVHLNYGRDLKQPPRLLKGGLNAWVDLLGPSSLQSTSSSSAKTAQLRLGNQEALQRRKSKYIAKPMKPDDVKAWQQTVNQDDIENASSPSLYRSTEDFIRRYPAVSLEQESMISLGPRPMLMSSGPHDSSSPSGNKGLNSDRLPTVPDAARSRPSHAGLNQNDSTSGSQGNTPPVIAPGGGGSLSQSSWLSNGKGFTALNNPGNWCYANSLVQVLLYSHIGNVLKGQEWRTDWKVPTKPDEKIAQPQLMMQILANLFHWMSTGGFKVMKAHTLMNYSFHVTKQIGNKGVIFGDSNQQDAYEFLTFLMEQLDDETNKHRDLTPEAIAKPDHGSRKIEEFTADAVTWWETYRQRNDSIIDRFMRSVLVREKKCGAGCGFREFDWDLNPLVLCSLRAANESSNDSTKDVVQSKTLAQLLDLHRYDNRAGDWKCEKCGKHTDQIRETYLYQLPRVLVVAFNRFGATASKLHDVIDWDLNNFDMARWGQSRRGKSTVYECFGVIRHHGSNIQSGHYTNYVRAPGAGHPNQWVFFNDSQTPRVVSMDDPDERRKLFKQGDAVPYLVFFRRKD